MTRTRALVRQWTLLRVLSQNVDGLSIDDMARQTAVNARTIRRDLKLFVEAGIPLRETVCRRNKKIWRIDRRHTAVLPHHAKDDCLAFSVALELLEPLQGTRFYEALLVCGERIAAETSAAARRQIEEQVEKRWAQWNKDVSLNISGRDIEELWAALVIANGNGQSIGDDAERDSPLKMSRAQ